MAERQTRYLVGEIQTPCDDDKEYLSEPDAIQELLRLSNEADNIAFGLYEMPIGYLMHVAVNGELFSQ